VKGAFFLGADQSPKFQVWELALPQSLGPHEVLVKNMACGVCGTDVHIYHGHKGSAEVKPPVVLGHEFAGVVEAVGSGVRDLAPGDHVALDPNMYCGLCRPCRMGRKQNCEALYALGVNTNGGFAQYTLCPDTQCFRVDQALPFDVAAMAEPLACAVHGIDLAGIVPGQSVLIIGGGTIGLLMVQLARLKGASCVLLSEPVELRRKLGVELGADGAIDPMGEDLSQRIGELTGQEGTDVVIECVGKPFAVEQALKCAGRGGHIVLFSVPEPEAVATLPLFDVYSKELSITGSIINPDTHQRAVNLLNSGRLNIQPLITHTFDLNHMDEAIHMQMSAESVKVTVHPQD